MYLYHAVIEQNSDIHISPQNSLDSGLSIRTATWRYTNGGDLFPEITELLRPATSPKWLDFKIAFGAELVPSAKPYFRFPLFSDKIFVFNQELSDDLFAYVEDEYMKAETGGGYFTKGLPSKEELVKQYWESMMTVDGYLKEKPYKEPEILIFEQVPKTLLEYIK
ncbi:hypothetical protein CHH83_18430 [Bacillus sp. 7586-K]|nr:hypothetical protein CHH83_18430 [Bacillus sp. 7586-K]